MRRKGWRKKTSKMAKKKHANVLIFYLAKKSYTRAKWIHYLKGGMGGGRGKGERKGEKTKRTKFFFPHN